MDTPPVRTPAGLSRRGAVGAMGAAVAGASFGAVFGGRNSGGQGILDELSPRAPVLRLQQSMAHWCFAQSKWNWSLERSCEEARAAGCTSVELLAPGLLPVLKPFGLRCALVSIDLKPGLLGFQAGWNNPENWEMLESTTKRSLDSAAEFGAPNVIAFVGMKARSLKEPEQGDFSTEQGAANCVEGLKRIAGYAEKRGVTLCLEMLNSRDGSAPMLGHPGYQGDHLDYCVQILERVDSARVKLLFDVYHVQIMDGDVIRRIRQHAPWIAHVHTAGVPGRGELDLNQEVNYPAVARALVSAGYSGFVGHEFLPTRDPVEGLREAVLACTGAPV